ncbi:MAG: TIGR04255 family protein [Ignavibacteriae bacterium HGW-Ignavibacteriae-1]|jgi:uncharacterized protein (TIGR04255 family)|nr:MAG: TIGR04255 family protein [Ignavibacteriae bacterium HGW-Ignavibacteriae-1]
MIVRDFNVLYTKKYDMNLPKTIKPCPIIDASVEIRFIPKINQNAVFGLIYQVLQDEFATVESLPILQLPEIVRSSDPNFKFKPLYKTSNNDYVVQIGPNVLTISSFPNYVGWDKFSKKIFEILHKVETIDIIDRIERLGLRYINFFEDNIFDNIHLKVRLGSQVILNKNTVVRTEIEHGDFNSTLQIANNGINNNRLGSIIDIDAFTSMELDKFFINKEIIINKGHAYEKELFFSLITDDFLKTLNPIY